MTMTQDTHGERIAAQLRMIENGEFQQSDEDSEEVEQ